LTCPTPNPLYLGQVNRKLIISDNVCNVDKKSLRIYNLEEPQCVDLPPLGYDQEVGLLHEGAELFRVDPHCRNRDVAVEAAGQMKDLVSVFSF
jgi:hypothetical protein